MTTTEKFACPACGEDDAWKADYYEAVWQSIDLLVGANGEPEMGDYTGVTGSYDDGSTLDECYRCGNCDYTIDLGKFEFVPAEDNAIHIAGLLFAAAYALAEAHNETHPSDDPALPSGFAFHVDFKHDGGVCSGDVQCVALNNPNPLNIVI